MAAALAPGLAGGTARGEARRIGAFQGGLAQAGIVAGVVGVAGGHDVGQIRGLQQIQSAQRDRRAAGLVRGEIDHALEQEQRLGLPAPRIASTARCW